MIHSRLFLTEVPETLLACEVDPVTLGIAALTGLGGFFASKSLSGGGAAPTPVAPPPQPAPPSSPAPKAAIPSQNTSFLGAAATPPAQSGQKTLLGQ